MFWWTFVKEKVIEQKTKKTKQETKQETNEKKKLICFSI